MKAAMLIATAKVADTVDTDHEIEAVLAQEGQIEAESDAKFVEEE